MVLRNPKFFKIILF